MRTVFLALTLIGLAGLAGCDFSTGAWKMGLAGALLVGVNYLYFTT